MKVCILANRINGRHQEMYLAFERSLLRKGIEFELTVRGRPWTWQRKVEWEHEMARKNLGNHLVFADAFDYLFVGEPDELEAIVRQRDLLLPCDTGDRPWPYANCVEFYDRRREKKSQWCWVNGAGPAGRADAIAEATADPWSRYSLGPHDTDQTFWTWCFLDGYGELDQKCELTQVLYDSGNPPNYITEALVIRNGRLQNTVTHSRPQFLHATGHSWWAIPKQLIPPEKEYKP